MLQLCTVASDLRVRALSIKCRGGGQIASSVSSREDLTKVYYGIYWEMLSVQEIKFCDMLFQDGPHDLCPLNIMWLLNCTSAFIHFISFAYQI